MNAALESFLKEVGAYLTPAKEPTLFAVGGRGYYENPASDLLEFFMKPNADHRLGDLFLSTYLECMKEDPRELNMSYISNDKIQREVVTMEGSKIDLQILGPDWCLIIENKIHHSEANPFEHYEKHADGLPGTKKFFSVLSPSGFVKKEGKTRDWKGVSYPDYCKALRQKMPEIDSYNPRSKWQLFAREFILHMENELYNPPMTPEQVSFVEKHDDQIAVAEKLAAQYRLFIRQELKSRLEESVPGNIFDTSEPSWPSHWLVFRCKSQHWGKGDMVLYKPEGKGKKFSIRAYLWDLSGPQVSNVKEALKHMKPPVIGGQHLYWDSPTGYDSSEEAIAELCKLAKTVSGLFKKSDSTP